MRRVMRKGYVLFLAVFVLLVFCAAPAMAKATKAEMAKVKAEMAAHNVNIAAAGAREKAAGARALTARQGATVAKAQAVVAGKAAEVARVKAVAAGKIAASAMARQDRVCTALGVVPVLGLGMRLYNSGEMKACMQNILDMRAGKKAVDTKKESVAGVVHALFKLPAALPEHAATDFAWRLTGANWRELDPVTVFLVDGRPYVLDLLVIGAKIAMPILACYPAASGLPTLATKGEIIGNAFLWQAAVGGGLSVLTGTGHQAATGLSSFHQYYKDKIWWTGRNPL